MAGILNTNEVLFDEIQKYIILVLFKIIPATSVNMEHAPQIYNWAPFNN